MHSLISQNLQDYKNDKGKFIDVAWPGCYPLMYFVSDHEVVCSNCANKERNYSDIKAVTANYNDDSCYCEDCGQLIEPAYEN